MTGWNIFAHSVRLVARNWKQALQIFLVPAAICIAVLLVIGGMIGVSAEATQSGGAVALLLLIVPIMLILMFWTVVAWHRFVLLKEYPQGWVPSFKFDRILAYLGRGIILLFIGIVVSVPAALVISAVANAGGMAIAVVLGLGAYLAIAVLMYRLVPTLPAAAIGKPLGLSQSLEATKGAAGAIIVLLVLLFAANLLAQLAFLGVSAISPILGGLLSAVVSAFLGVVGISVLTTFYGHYIEGRSID